jgi:hypothetical protein
MFSARGGALNIITAGVQLRVLHNSVILFARLKLRGTNYTNISKEPAACTCIYPEDGSGKISVRFTYKLNKLQYRGSESDGHPGIENTNVHKTTQNSLAKSGR